MWYQLGFTKTKELTTNMGRQTAIIPGSFDPPHDGHLGMIVEAAATFEKVIVLVLSNPDKRQPAFSLKERLQMLYRLTHKIPNVQIAHSDAHLLVKAAENLGANIIVRGIRNMADLEYERQMQEFNHILSGGKIRTWFVMPKNGIVSSVSSSAIRQMLRLGGCEMAISKVVSQDIKSVVMSKESDDHEEFPDLFLSFMKMFDDLASKYRLKFNRGKLLGHYAELLEAYSQTHRRYHVLRHIKQGLALFRDIYRFSFEGVHVALQKPLVMLFAWFYHDFFYDIKLDAMNEERSADHAKNLALSLGLPQEFADDVFQYIMSTKHHALFDINCRDDRKYLLDMDLWILGQPEAVFDSYEADVRSEYSVVPEMVFRDKRTKILESFLKRGHVYLTRAFEKYEQQAQANLRRSIAKLSS